MMCVTWFEIILLGASAGLACIAQMYKTQRDDLAAWVVHNNPDLFED